MKITTEMDGKDLAERIKGTPIPNEGPFEVSEKQGASPTLNAFKFWGKPETFQTAEEVLNSLATHFGKRRPQGRSAWKLVEQQKAIRGGTIYTFLNIPHPDSPMAKKEVEYTANYVHVRVKPPVEAL